VNRQSAAALYGPSTGDRVRLGDSDLVVEVESDSQRAGRVPHGFGRTGRDGLLMQAVPVRESCDLVADTLAVLDGRTVHAFHVEGCGGVPMRSEPADRIDLNRLYLL
jgi:urease alpha subunit